MKKYIVYSILAVLVLFTASCRKSDNPRIPTLARVPVPYIKADATKSQSISVLNPTSFNQTFTFTPFFLDDAAPKQMDLVVIKNGVNTSVKTIQAGFTAFPATANVTGAQLISLFGTIKLGDTYTFGLDITTQDGTVFHAFPAVGVGYGSGVLNEYNGATNTTPLAAGGGVIYQIAFGALCAYDPAIYQGNFVVVKDDWQDTSPGDIIVFTPIDATHFSFIYPTAVNPQPIIVTVNPANNTPSIALQTIGTAWVYDATPPPPTAKTTPGSKNNVAPCDKTISLNMTWTEGSGSFPNLVFSLKKQ